MEIKGFHKLTLIDYPGKIACTLFLNGCNFRCGFCHNPELVLGQIRESYSKEEILEFLKKRKGLLEAVCITGGEPLLTIETEFLKKIRELGYLIKIDTNGSCPDKLRELIDLNLIDFVSMDIKSSKEKYKDIINCNIDMNRIEKSIKLISDLGNYEFRTTIIEKIHDIDEVKNISIWLNQLINKRPKKFCLQGFKNRDKVLDLSFRNEKDTSEEFLKNLKNGIKDYFEEIDIRV